MSRRKRKSATVAPPEAKPISPPKPLNAPEQSDGVPIRKKAEPVAKLSPLEGPLRMVGVKAAAAASDVTVTTIWNWIKSGELKSVKAGGRRLIATTELRRLLGFEAQ